MIHLSWHLHRKTAPREEATMLAGVDVSSFQGPPAGWRTEAGAIEWAAVKFTELEPAAGGRGTAYLNPDAASDWAYLRQAGKGRIAYLFAHPAVSPAATAGLFATAMHDYGLDDADGIMLDHETTDGLSPAAVNTWALTVCRLLEHELGRRPLVYTFIDFALGGNCASLGGYPLWIADPSSPPGHPRVPDPWRTWAIHQYAVTGIDRDMAACPSLAAMASDFGRPAPKPAPAPRITEEDDMLLLARDVPLPVPIPNGTRALRFAAAATAEVRVEWRNRPGDTATLAWEQGAQEVTVPAGLAEARVTRLDDGTEAVSLALTG